MPGNRKGGKPSKKVPRPTEPVSSQEKIARLLGIIAIKDVEQLTDRVTMLRAVGFEVAEVASMLGITENHVNVAAHHGRKKRKGKKAAKGTRK